MHYAQAFVTTYWQTLTAPLLDSAWFMSNTMNISQSVVKKMWKTFGNQYLLRTLTTNAYATVNTERTATVSLSLAHCMHRVQTSLILFEPVQPEQCFYWPNWNQCMISTEVVSEIHYERSFVYKLVRHHCLHSSLWSLVQTGAEIHSVKLFSLEVRSASWD